MDDDGSDSDDEEYGVYGISNAQYQWIVGIVGTYLVRLFARLSSQIMIIMGSLMNATRCLLGSDKCVKV